MKRIKLKKLEFKEKYQENLYFETLEDFDKYVEEEERIKNDE